MQCVPCGKRGINRDGAAGGVCFVHRRTRCAVCDRPSGGGELCVDCVYAVERQRNDAAANFRILAADRRDYRTAIGEEGLAAARRQMYGAVDSLFQILAFTIQRLAQHIEEMELALHGSDLRRLADAKQQTFPFEEEAA